jgi:acetyl esterase/lipase
MKLLAIVFCILSTGVFTSCSKEATEATAAKTFLNVSYGSDTKQQMDVYLPANRTATSTHTIIMIHGGGWSEGDKLDFTPYVDTLKRRFPTYAITNLNYRLATGSGNFFPSQENDVKAALDFYLSKRNDYGVSDKIVLLGASAGAHLALLQAYKNSATLNIKAVINFFGPSDMTDLYNNPASAFAPPAAIAAVVGATPSSNATRYFQSSPINFITAAAAPTLTLQGGLDPLVRPAQQVALHNKLTAAAVVNEYVNYPNEYHGWVGANLVHSFNRIQAFIATHVQ